jgi:hypothetical protein
VNEQDLSDDPHAAILLEAWYIWRQRNAKYKDNWKHQGARGNLFKLRWKVERAWQVLWHSDHIAQADMDDLLDCINYCAAAIRCAREGNRDGAWFW